MSLKLLLQIAKLLVLFALIFFVSSPLLVHANICKDTQCVSFCDVDRGENCGGPCKTDADCALGTVKPPLPSTTTAQGLFTNILRIVFFAAGIWSFLNIIIAGYQFMNAGGDPKAITAAWAKIWQSLVGLVIIVSSFIFAAIFGFLIFHDPLFMFKAPPIQ